MELPLGQAMTIHSWKRGVTPLEMISTNTPIYIQHQSGQIGVANSKALEMLGITAATPDLEGGVIFRRSGQVLGASQRVSAETAVKALTLWGAWQHYEEHIKGFIEPGKLADMVILSDAPTAMNPAKISSIKVLNTIKEGIEIYRLADD